MDGANPRLIASTGTANETWPNCITVDKVADRIYWSDAKSDTIETADLEGKDRRWVLKEISRITSTGWPKRNAPPSVVQACFQTFVYSQTRGERGK